MLTFADIGLNNNILKALDKLGFETPTPIQAQAIPHLMVSQKDLIALAQTGTGKTAAFSLPVIQHIDPLNLNVQALILSPTRELSLQISKNIEEFTQFSPKIRQVAVYGGAPIVKQIRELERGAQIVVGTPGRVLDLIKRRKLHVEEIKYLVLDEADEMLNMGFKDELDAILENTPEEKQTLLFSATMPKSVLSIAKKYMNKPDQISSGKHNVSADKVDHMYYLVQSRDKYQALRRIIDAHPDMYGIVFCRTRRETQQVADNLIRDGYNSEAIHGDLSQHQRSKVMNRFRAKHCRMLVATDVAARGIDVNDITHVIHYSLPDTVDAYIHRSGRTGRAQKSGTSLCIIHSKETKKLRFYQDKIGKEFVHALVPSGEEVCRTRLMRLIFDLKNTQLLEEKISPYLADILQELQDLDKETLVKHLVSQQFDRYLGDYQSAPDLNLNKSASLSGSSKKGKKASGVTLRINLGRMDSFGVKSLFYIVNQNDDLNGIDIGGIKLMDTHTLFEVNPSDAETFISTLNGGDFKGRDILVKHSDKPLEDFGNKRRSGGGRSGKFSRNSRGKGKFFNKKNRKNSSRPRKKKW